MSFNEEPRGDQQSRLHLVPGMASDSEAEWRHGCQMAIARFLDRMCLALRASGLWLRYAALQNLIPSFPWIAPHALHPGAIRGKEGIKFCHLATSNEGGHRRANNLLTRPRRNQTPSAPPASSIYSIPDASTDKPPDVSFNPPTYEEATTMGNVNWNPDTSAPDIPADKKYWSKVVWLRNQHFKNLCKIEIENQIWATDKWNTWMIKTAKPRLREPTSRLPNSKFLQPRAHLFYCLRIVRGRLTIQNPHLSVGNEAC